MGCLKTSSVLRFKRIKDRAEESKQQVHTLRKIYQVLNETISKGANIAWKLGENVLNMEKKISKEIATLKKTQDFNPSTLWVKAGGAL